MNIEEKKIFIYKNIDKIEYHNEIVDYIKTNDIKYTENSNGFFVNISLIDEHINNIYNILQYIIFNNIENDNDRFFKILSVIDDLMSKSMEELHEMYVESLPTIIYNQNVVRDINPNVLLDKLFDRISRV